MKRALFLLLLALQASAAVVIVAPSGGESFSGGVQFVQNATQDYDYGQVTTLPEGFGDAEYTFKLVVTAYQPGTTGDTDSCPGCRENWGDENVAIYSASSWWFRPNFLIDGHRNGDYDAGTFSFQVFNVGYIRWTVGDGSSAEARVGDLHGIQNEAGTNILDGEVHVIHAVREFTGASDSTYSLYVDGILQDTETSTNRTDMAATWWDEWTGYFAGQEGWFFAAEKQAALVINSINDYPDFKGIIHEVSFYGDALSAAEISADQGPVDTNHVDYLDHWAFLEGTGLTTTSANGLDMTLNNEQAGGFWP